MAERQMSGKNLPLWVGTGSGTPEVFKLIACLTTITINQGSNTITTETFCGTIKSDGTNNASISFSLTPLFEADAGKASFDSLQSDYKNHTVHNWKITTAPNVAGDPILSFSGFISELTWDLPAEGLMTGTGTIEVDGDGITTTIVP